MVYSILPVLLILLSLLKPSIIDAFHTINKLDAIDTSNKLDAFNTFNKVDAFNTSNMLEPLHIMIIYSTQGNWANISDYPTLVPHWENHLRNKLKTDLDWPFSVVLESWDVKSNFTYIKEIMQERLSSTILPGITAIIGEGDDGYPGSMIARIAAQFEIPCILSSLQPDIHLSNAYKLPPEQNTSFLMIGSTVRVFEQAIETYLKMGVETVVAVASNRYDQYNNHSCYDTADIMVKRGVKLLGKFSINLEDNGSKVVEIIDAIKILNPDLVLWCDYLACSNHEDKEEYLPLKSFKAANYLPKALTMLDCLGIVQTDDDAEKKMFQFVSGMYIYGFMDIYMYICLYMYVYMCIYICTYIHTYMFQFFQVRLLLM
jgi:hypothetical protein